MIEFLTGLNINRELMVFICSMLPVVELRGAIPLGISLKISPIKSTIISIIGNMIILIILLNILEPINKLFEKTELFDKTIGWVKRRSMKKSRLIKKYSNLGLLIFVAIPIPTTGVWTGSVIATILKIDKRKSFMSMATGLFIASGIILGIYYGVFN